MRVRITSIVILLAALFSPLVAVPTPVAAANCQFVRGFGTLHSLIPNVIGNCVTNEYSNPVNGDVLQQTTGPNGAGGLLVWRPCGNLATFTDGYHTWINGPQGLQERLNTQRFSWEQTTCAPGSTSASPVLASRSLTTGVSTGNPSAADQAAIDYVTSHYPGVGQVRVLKTKPDVDRGVAVYDVRTLAPNGTIYVVHVQQSDNAVLWANPAENQRSGVAATTPEGASHGVDASPDAPETGR